MKTSPCPVPLVLLAHHMAVHLIGSSAQICYFPNQHGLWGAKPGLHKAQHQIKLYSPVPSESTRSKWKGRKPGNRRRRFLWSRENNVSGDEALCTSFSMKNSATCNRHHLSYTEGGFTPFTLHGLWTDHCSDDGWLTPLKEVKAKACRLFFTPIM